MLLVGFFIELFGLVQGPCNCCCGAFILGVWNMLCWYWKSGLRYDVWRWFLGAWEECGVFFLFLVVWWFLFIWIIVFCRSRKLAL